MWKKVEELRQRQFSDVFEPGPCIHEMLYVCIVVLQSPCNEYGRQTEN